MPLIPYLKTVETPLFFNMNENSIISYIYKLITYFYIYDYDLNETISNKIFK